MREVASGRRREEIGLFCCPFYLKTMIYLIVGGRCALFMKA
jgi:hypothetical protein